MIEKKEKAEKHGLKNSLGLFSVAEIIKQIEVLAEGQILILDLVYDSDITKVKDGDPNAWTI